jgi:6-phosphogluconolactonase
MTEVVEQEMLVASDVDEHTALAAEYAARIIQEAVDARGVARVAVSGGRTPSEAHRYLASVGLPYDAVEWYWVDERAAPPDSPRSNYCTASRDLSLAGGKHGRAIRMQAEGDLPAAAAAYEAMLRRTFGIASAVAFDVMMLGVGDDGHTASLFPGTGAVRIDDRLVAAIPEQPARGLEARLTLTAPVILEARFVMVLARGAEKCKVIERGRHAGDEDEMPIRLLRRARGHVVWVLDRDAAGERGTMSSMGDVRQTPPSLRS